MFALDGTYETPCHAQPEEFDSSVEKAKALCAGCRIQLICLDHALHYEQISGEMLKGVRAGLTEAERTQTTLTRLA